MLVYGMYMYSVTVCNTGHVHMYKDFLGSCEMGTWSKNVTNFHVHV